jgi:hypothetical protein
MDVQHDPGDLAPVSALSVGIKHPKIGDHVLLIVLSERQADLVAAASINIRAANARSISMICVGSVTRPERLSTVSLADGLDGR